MSNDIDNILESLEGAFPRGHRYFIKTVSYHYIGTVHDIGVIGNHYYVRLENVVGVSQAGSDEDATVKIVTGKRKPEHSERYPPAHLVRIWVQSITEDQEVPLTVP